MTRLNPDPSVGPQPEGISAADREDNETNEQFRKRLTIGLRRQMMFVSGETAEPSTETTTLIEEIVRQQVIEMVGRIPCLHSARSREYDANTGAAHSKYCTG